ncbi:hypothetical protein H6G20_12745 [Desertifilum sp. FACHB-1129]|uniref:Uncharacterized protein n=1 Tax=Desertifilum tharense IPPAS B-1220 TaxID=1781255 RepID=A0A1E5QEY4_9CYAN|nr:MULTISPECIES: hypothetical protein [Desertifilum]MDA0212901.1 hypothetical protein [Cyanobacteria bacterium FC1]MBD2312531.1 hypothetical protein [Desertifilum sp. FACHB-1129]MBD2323473.1 hypothetical protein [Desertifilum sp. FACHB-866]MBD2333318.1 hypothetical protein [Desertifilum sp. FACHB-868]OEJ73167.1 hypothetical protein BH720_21735 [Desertifilum tharense IPPAS B-1220]
MVWVFSLSAECGTQEGNAKQFAQHFQQTQGVLSNNLQYQVRADVFQDLEENWWCRVCPQSVTETGVATPEDAYLLTELGILLYQHLQSAPPFRYALVGVEVDEFRTYSELLLESSNLEFPGLVLAIAIANQLGVISTFRPFSSGYVWQPYQGETYNPLLVSPELKSKLNLLLAVG